MVVCAHGAARGAARPARVGGRGPARWGRRQGGFAVRNPPILIAVLGFFGALAGFYWIYLGLRLLGFDWFGLLGDLQPFEAAGLWGWLALLGGIGWIAAALALWAQQPWGWMFANIMAGLRLFEGVPWVPQDPRTGVGISAAGQPIIIPPHLPTGGGQPALGLGAPPGRA